MKSPLLLAVLAAATLCVSGCWKDELFQCYKGVDCPATSTCEQGLCTTKKSPESPGLPDGGARPDAKPEERSAPDTRPQERPQPDAPTSVCQSGETRACYSGPAGTQNQGLCLAGTQRCDAGVWGPCRGEVQPTTELCDKADNDCDGAIDEGCEPDKSSHSLLGLGTASTDSAMGVVVDSKGYTYIAGRIDNSNNAPKGASWGDTTLPHGPFLAKMSPQGEALWALSIPSPDGGEPAVQIRIALGTNDQIMVAGLYTKYKTKNASGGGQIEYQGLMMAKFDAEGKLLGNEKIGAGEVGRIHGLAVDAKGTIAVCGEFGFTIKGEAGKVLQLGQLSVTSRGFSDVYVASFDASGKALWAQAIGGSGFDRCNGVALDSKGSAYVVGRVQGAAHFGSSKVEEANSQKEKMYLAKFDAQGNTAWIKTDESARLHTQATGVVVDGSDRITIVGGETEFTTRHVAGFFVAQYDQDGALQWHHKPTAKASAQAIAVDASGNIAIVGTMKGRMTWGKQALEVNGMNDSFDGFEDVFVVRLAADGTQKEAYVGGSGTKDLGVGVALSADGKRVIAIADVRGNARFASQQYSSVGSYDIVAWQIAKAP